ncbi:cupin domain protein [Asticcacaulis biprosthecium C19]|uniref:Cupin domain protein n=1 Tax=Asticcacaulis biprosthecium C19 TaxID=715226 RepID=F4QST1_9CAUL|nr:cupin domain-containing protein [Asticcacaulis biprosthecium]EGF89801.1 cupin domain protein [Asticcacaulis biprosthecium C19]
MDTNSPARPVAVKALEVATRTRPSNYPEPYFSMMAGREKRTLGDLFGLSNFGVNLVRILPGGQSALRHWHTRQDEFVYVVSGRPILITDAGETQLEPGMCAGFKAGVADGHRVVNRTDEEVVYLEVGDRTPGDAATYPDDDIQANQIDGQWVFTHKDGSAFP